MLYKTHSDLENKFNLIGEEVSWRITPEGRLRNLAAQNNDLTCAILNAFSRENK